METYFSKPLQELMTAGKFFPILARLQALKLIRHRFI